MSYENISLSYGFKVHCYRQFNAAGPEQLKARSPNFVLVVHLTYLANAVGFKYLRLLADTDCTQSTRYCNARPVWIRCIFKQNLYLILLATGNQWSCFSGLADKG